MPISSSKQSFEAVAFGQDADRLVKLQDRYTAAWHKHPAAAPSALEGFERVVVEQHLSNFQLWHAEDSTRTPGVTDREVAQVKRFIDTANQRRNDLTERCDSMLLAWLARENLPVESAELHSESPGLIIDRLSILSLKLFHTQEEAARLDAPAGHRERNLERWRVLSEQRSDLAAAMGRLWRQVLSGQRRFKLYRQMKMYNDPALNPAIYQAPASRS